jgi:hypothetical protein
VSAGGAHAFYPSKVKYHYVHPQSGKLDLLGKITEEAHRQNLKIIARVDFSHARAEVLKDHPEWFQRDAQGKPVALGQYYSTCALGGYRNEEFAFKIIQELQRLYGVRGFHLNAAPSFPLCHCKTCVAAYGRPLPVNEKTADPAAWLEYQQWRRDALSQRLAGYYRVMRELDAESFFMGELFLGPGVHIPTLVRHQAFSQLLFTPRDPHRDAADLPVDWRASQTSRFEVPLTCDLGRALEGTRPLINLKMQMRYLWRSQSYMPRAEFFYIAYQSIAHGAGLKVPTFAVPKNVLDARSLPDLATVFDLMQRQQSVLDTSQPIAEVALVWPEQALLGTGPEAAALQSEALGLYTGLKMRHVCLALLYNEQLSAEHLARYSVVVLPSAVGLTEDQAGALVSYIEMGGRLVLLDSPAPGATSFGHIPGMLTQMLGGTWTQNAKRAEYTVVTIPTRPLALQGCGPIPLTESYRQVTPDPRAQVWYRDAHADDQGVEDIDELTVGKDPIVLFSEVGAGSVVYVATGLGQMIQKIGHADYLAMLETFVYHGLRKPRPLETNAPSTVAVTFARWKEGRVVHLVNGTGPAPLDVAIPVGPIELNLAWEGAARAEVVVPGEQAQPLPARHTQGRLQLTLPRLEIYAQVVVRSVS